MDSEEKITPWVTNSLNIQAIFKTFHLATVREPGKFYTSFQYRPFIVMSSKRSRQIGSSSHQPRDESFLDLELGVRFFNRTARELYGELMSKTPIRERVLDSTINVPFLNDFFSNHHWGIIHEPAGNVHELVAQFYANIHDINRANYSFKTMVGGTVINVNREIVSSLVQVPIGGSPFPPAERRSRQELSVFLFDQNLVRNDGKVFIQGAGIHLKVAAKLIVENMLPSTCDNNRWIKDVTEFISLIVEGRQIDFCRVIVNSMINVKHGSNRRPGLPCLISRICTSYNLQMIGTNLSGPTVIRRSSIEKMMPSTVRNVPIAPMAAEADEMDLLQIELSEAKEMIARLKRENLFLKKRWSMLYMLYQLLERNFMKSREITIMRVSNL